MTLLNINDFKKFEKDENPFTPMIELIKANFKMLKLSTENSMDLLQENFSSGNTLAKVFYNTQSGNLYPYHIDIANREENWGLVIRRQPDQSRLLYSKPEFKPYKPQNIPS